MKAKGNFWVLLFISFGQNLPHYTIEYRSHFTNFHATVSNGAGGLQIGQTECFIIMIFYQLFAVFCPDRTKNIGEEIDIKGMTGFEPPFKLRYNMVIALSTFYLSFQYVTTNFYLGYKGSKDKMYAILLMWPFFQFIILMFLASSFSQFWEKYNVLFMVGFGFIQTHMTTYLNLMSCAQSKMNSFIIDPVLFVIVLYFDYFRILEPKIVAVLYIILMIYRFVRYCLFFKSICDQICDYCQIPLLQVKQGWTPPGKGKK